jgi:hypothetical protein
MPRRIFISYQHKDQMTAKGFNLLRWNENVDVEFVGRHLLDPVDSKNEQYIKSEILKQLKGTSVTVVLIGKDTHDSSWVRDEIQWSLEKENPNGILAIRLEPDTPLPADSPVGKALRDAGAEIIGWDTEKFADAIERAAIAAGRVQSMRLAALQPTGDSCGR